MLTEVLGCRDAPSGCSQPFLYPPNLREKRQFLVKLNFFSLFFLCLFVFGCCFFFCRQNVLGVSVCSFSGATTSKSQYHLPMSVQKGLDVAPNKKLWIVQAPPGLQHPRIPMRWHWSRSLGAGEKNTSGIWSPKISHASISDTRLGFFPFSWETK